MNAEEEVSAAYGGAKKIQLDKASLYPQYYSLLDNHPTVKIGRRVHGDAMDTK